MVRVSIKSLKSGMKVGKSVFDVNGTLLLGRGVSLNDYFIKRLHDLCIASIFIQNENTEDIIPFENITEIVRGSTIRHMKELFKSLDNVQKDMTNHTHAVVLETISSPRFKDTFSNNPAFNNIVGAAKSIVDELINGDMILGLNSIKTYDNYTFQHSIDVSIVAIMMGRKLGLPAKRLREIGIGCLLHDMGKTFISEDIINKPTKLTPKEYDQIKEHTTIGYELIKDVASIGVLPPHVALQHHEKQDGTGYPRGLFGKNNLSISYEPNLIHLYGSIAAVADVYDALSSDRPYRQSFPPEKVIEIMHQMSGNHLNRMVLLSFLSVAPVYPEGSTIRIIKGDYRFYIGVITGINKVNLARPIIRLVYGPERELINPIEINLLENEDISIETIIL